MTPSLSLARFGRVAGLLVLSALLLGGCSSSSDNDIVDANLAAIAVGATADYSTASHAVIDTESPYAAEININPSANTDVTVSAWGSYFYRIERFGANSVTKYDIANPDTPIWQCSTEGSESNSNPYQLVQVAEDKAYLLRYGSGKLWIVDPSIASSADCDTGFKIGEIDLSSFDGDGVPEMSAAVVVGNRLFVAIQRLIAFTPSQKSQVVVIDTTDDSLIDVDPDLAGVQPITLPGRNPGSMQYVSSLDRIFVQSVGKYDTTAYGGSAAEYTGGIDVIDPTLLTAEVLLDDDGDITKQISAMAVIDDDTGYFVSYAGYGDNSLYRFDPTTGAVHVDNGGTPIALGNLAQTNIRALAAGPDDSLWVAIDSGLRVIDGGDDSVLQNLVDTQMNPSAIAFAVQP